MLIRVIQAVSVQYSYLLLRSDQEVQVQYEGLGWCAARSWPLLGICYVVSHPFHAPNQNLKGQTRTSPNPPFFSMSLDAEDGAVDLEDAEEEDEEEASPSKRARIE